MAGSSPEDTQEENNVDYHRLRRDAQRRRRMTEDSRGRKLRRKQNRDAHRISRSRLTDDRRAEIRSNNLSAPPVVPHHSLYQIPAHFILPPLLRRPPNFSHPCNATIRCYLSHFRYLSTPEAVVRVSTHEHCMSFRACDQYTPK
jgi:hypothetical protein